MKKSIYIIILFCVSCSSPSTFTSKQYTDLHFKTRHDHIDLVQHCHPTIDTMLQTIVNMLEENEDQEECLRSWHRTKTFIHDAEIQNHIYVGQMVLNEETTPLHTKMLDSHNRIIGLESDLGYDIELAIRSNDKNKAIQRIKDLKRLIGNEWIITRETAEQYISIAFGEESKKK
jgi:hypothetical protein